MALVKEVLIKSFDKLRMNGKLLILFVASLSNHERNQTNKAKQVDSTNSPN